MSVFKYYNGESPNPYAEPGTIFNVFDWDLMINNPKAFWWEFERTYGCHFETVLRAVENLAYKHSDYAPIAELDIVKSYLDNAVL